MKELREKKQLIEVNKKNKKKMQFLKNENEEKYIKVFMYICLTFIYIELHAMYAYIIYSTHRFKIYNTIIYDYIYI